MTTTSGETSVIAWAMPQPSAWQAWASTSRAISLPSAAAWPTICAVSCSSLPPQRSHRSAAYSSSASSVSISRWRTSSGEVRCQAAGERHEGVRYPVAQPRLRRGGDAPAAGQRLDGLVGPIGVQARAQVADLGGAVAVAAIDLAVDDQSAADAGADGDEQHHLAAPARAVPRLGQGRRVAIVFQPRRQTQRPTAPVDQRKAFPAVDVMAFDHHAAGRIDRPAKADADRRHVVSRRQHRAAELRSARRMPAAPELGPDVETFERHQLAIAAPDAQLQLGAADFDAQIERLRIARSFRHANAVSIRKWPVCSRGESRSSSSSDLGVAPFAG